MTVSRGKGGEGIRWVGMGVGREGCVLPLEWEERVANFPLQPRVHPITAISMRVTFTGGEGEQKLMQGLAKYISVALMCVVVV